MTTATPPARRPDLESLYTINPDGSRNFLHPADVRGRWQVRKQIVWTILLVIYAVLPWIEINGMPAVFLDIPGREAWLFGLSFTNQDTYLLFFLLTGIGFALFVATSMWGRVWCGFACPQTVFLEGIARRLERWIEGPREVRIRRNLAAWTAGTWGRKAAKWSLFLALALAVAVLVLSYFLPRDQRLELLTADPANHTTAFAWMIGLTALLFFDFAWFREQTCVVVCPYGRLQSALIDADTIGIGYDRARGEPRGKVGATTGDCIDCGRCVAVCPTGIDIRNGAQMECIGCANCVDACDEMMAKVDRAPGLIRYDSQRGFEGRRRGLLRPRTVLYGLLLLVGASVLTVAATQRSTFEARLLRPRGFPYTKRDDRWSNLVTLHLQNKSRLPRVFSVTSVVPEEARPFEPEFLIPTPRVPLGAMGATGATVDAQIPLFVTVATEDYRGPFPFEIVVRDSASGEEKRIAIRFLGP